MVRVLSLPAVQVVRGETMIVSSPSSVADQMLPDSAAMVPLTASEDVFMLSEKLTRMFLVPLIREPEAGETVAVGAVVSEPFPPPPPPPPPPQEARRVKPANTSDTSTVR
jgi:hypothetical protein